MSDKGEQIEAMIRDCGGRGIDAHYLAFFECFNRGWYFEAHEVLETPWHADRRGPNAAFYKGLIQLAGAFVHLQKRRPQPALAIFKLARANLEPYLPFHEQLDVTGVMSLTARWVQELESNHGETDHLRADNAPKLSVSVARADIHES